MKNKILENRENINFRIWKSDKEYLQKFADTHGITLSNLMLILVGEFLDCQRHAVLRINYYTNYNKIKCKACKNKDCNNCIYANPCIDCEHFNKNTMECGRWLTDEEKASKKINEKIE